MKWLSDALRYMPFVVGAIHGAELVLHAAPGKDKLDAAMELLRTMLGAVDPAAAAAVLDPEVDAATRAFMSSYVTLQNARAKQAAAPAKDAPGNMARSNAVATALRAQKAAAE